MKSHMSQDSGIHHLHFTASDPLQSFSDFRKVSRSPIIRSIRLLAAHATVATCTLPAEHTVPSFTSTAPTPSRFAVKAIMWLTSKTETENRFWPFPKPKNRFYSGNPVLETLLVAMWVTGGDRTQWTWDQLTLVGMWVTGGDRKDIRPELLVCISKHPTLVDLWGSESVTLNSDHSISTISHTQMKMAHVC